MKKILKSSFAVFFTGLVIKLMDDYLDQELDHLNGNQTLAQNLDRAILPYTLLVFSLAMLCDYKLSISLFWASYIVGMGVNNNKIIRALSENQELFFLLISGFFLLDSKQFLFSIAIILFIQTTDDYIDYYREKYISNDNFINYLGKAGTSFILVLSLIVSLNLDWQLSLIVIGFSLLIAGLLRKKAI